MGESVLRKPDVVHFKEDFLHSSGLLPEKVVDIRAFGDIVLAFSREQPNKKLIVKRFSLLRKERLARNMLIFNREAQFMQSVDHPFLAKSIHAAICPEYASISVKYYPNGTLDLYRGSMLLAVKEKCVIQVACALRYLHKNNLVHLDVKPANIFIDEQRNAILGDFGAAMELKPQRQTLPKRHIGGTPGFMAPELIATTPDVQLDPYKLDSYSLGVVLWCLVCDRHARPNTNHLKEAMNRPDFRPDIRNMLLKLLQPDPTKRSTVADFLHTVRQDNLFSYIIDRN